MTDAPATGGTPPGRRRRPRPPVALLAIPALWTGLFLLVPGLVLVAISLSTATDSIPPVAPLLVQGGPGEGWPRLVLHPGTYGALFADPVFAVALLHSTLYAAATTVLALALGLPMAHAIATAPRRARPILLAAVILPFWTSFLIRIYAWIEILRPDGLLASLLHGLDPAASLPAILDTPSAVLLGMTYAYLPFAVLPIVSVLERADPALTEAAADLGAAPLAAFVHVTVPLALPGILAGALLVFVPALGEYVIPAVLGGGNVLTVAGELWNEFFPDGDWPTASALAVLLLAVVVAPLLVLDRLRVRVLGERRP